MTTTIGSLAVSLSMDASSFNGSMTQVDRNLRAMGSELRAARALGNEYGRSVEGLSSKKDILTRSVGASTIKLEAERRKYDELVASGKATEAQLERQARRVNEAQLAHNRLSTELNQVTEDLRIQSSAWTQAGERMQTFGGQLNSVGDGMTKVGKGLSMKVTAPLMAMGGAAFKAAVDFEDAFAGVRKTVDASEAEFQVLSDGIREMAKEMPAAATEIAGVAEAAGQLGIKKENILGFTKTMTDLGVATNMTSEEAATALARLANITKMDQGNFDKLGSSIVALGNNFATTEGEITEMALRLAGAGSQIGMSEADILGLSTALSSVGIQAEMGGSAISRVMVKMQVATSTGLEQVIALSEKTGMSLRDMQLMAANDGKGFKELAGSLRMTNGEMKAIIDAGVDLENFSKIAGMSGEEFKKAFSENAIGAIGSFIDGLGTAEEKGDSAINMLQEMGITSVLLRDSLLRAGGANVLFGNAIDIANVAWDENNALTKEAQERYKTTASQIKILWNEVKDLGMEFGNVLIPVVKDGINTIKPWISSLAQASDSTKKTVLATGALVAAIGPVLVVGGTLIKSIGTIATVTGTMSTAIGAAGSAFTVLAGPIGWTIAGVALLATGIGAATLAYQKSNEINLEVLETKQKEIDANDELIESFDALQSKNKLTNAQMLRYLDIQAELEMTNAPDKVAALKDEQAKLLEKSSLTNEEMDEFLGLNQKVIDNASETVKSISSQGEAYANNTLALKELNAEKAKELQNAAYETLTKAIQKENSLMKEQKQLIAEVNEKNELQKEKKKEISSLAAEIWKRESEVLKLEELKNGASADEIINLDSKIRREKELLEEKNMQKSRAEEMIITYGKQLGERDKLLETNRKEIAALEEAKFKYEEIILAQAGITAEKGRSGAQLDSELTKLELQKSKLKELLESNKIGTAEYQEQNSKIDTQIGKLQNAKTELQLINDVAGKTVYKDVVINENPKNFWTTLDENLKRPITKDVNIRYNGVNGPQEPGYAKGTTFHPGGRFIAGEEGFELGRMGNRWEMLNLGMYNRPAGFEVFTHEESKKIIGALNGTPAYATGASSFGAVDSVLNGLNRPLELKIANALSGLSGTIKTKIDIVPEILSPIYKASKATKKKALALAEKITEVLNNPTPKITLTEVKF